MKEDHSAEGSYYTWVDWFDTFGLGQNVPIATGNQNSSLLALVDGKWVNLVVPYPMGFSQMGGGPDRRCQCRLEGPRAMGDTSTGPCSISKAAREPPKVVKFQIRPDPLAN